MLPFVMGSLANRYHLLWKMYFSKISFAVMYTYIPNKKMVPLPSYPTAISVLIRGSRGDNGDKNPCVIVINIMMLEMNNICWTIDIKKVTHFAWSNISNFLLK